MGHCQAKPHTLGPGERGHYVSTGLGLAGRDVGSHVGPLGKE